VRSRRATRALGAFLVAAMLLASSSGPAGATSPAEALFQEGRRLLTEGQTDEACARFSESYAMVASSGTLLNLALCHQTQGKTATAWNEYRAAARLARNQGREDRATVADGKAAALEAALPRLTTTAVEATPGLRVSTEAGPLGEGGLGVEVPIDPGTHEVTASAPGYRPWATTLEVKEADQLALEIPRLEPEPLPAPRTRAATPPTFLDPSRGAEDPSARERSSLDLYLAGGGGVLLVAGTVVWSVAYAKLQSAKAACTRGCSQAEYDGNVSDIQTLKDVAIGSWITGGALVAASGAHYLLRRKRAPLTVAVDPVNVGLLLRGSF
jgi:hypothetical protein